MGAGHTHALYIHEHTPLHRLSPEAKIVAAFGMIVPIAITPRQAVWAFALYGLAIVALLRLGKVPIRFVAVRLLALTPFIFFAFFIPFVASGETVEILGLNVSVEGLWGAWNILAKAVLGATVSIALTATTEVPDLIRGFGVLRVPPIFTSIAIFMIRYLQLIADELGRTRVAMTSRGYDPRWLAQARPIASSAGALFVRSYERGERVHASMLSRGFSGIMPEIEERRTTSAEWRTIGLLVVGFGGIAICALVVT